MLGVELQRAEKLRPRQERVMLVVRPVAARLIRWLATRDVNPLHVVLTHGALGLGAAVAIAQGSTLALGLGALALLGKMILDNADGGLARATGRVTLTGRYLDTIVDAVVNIALFAALATHGPIWAAVAAWVVLTLILSVDYNLERLYREARDPARRDPKPSHRAAPDQAAPNRVMRDRVALDAIPIGASQRIYVTLRAIYRRLFEPQDRAVEALDRWAFARLYGAPYADADRTSRLAWNDLLSTATMVDLGLSTQMTVLAALLLAGVPFAWVWLVLAQGIYVVCVWLLRAWRFQAYLRTR